MADEQVDPRYDPAFQRGFDGPVVTGTRGVSALRQTALVTPAPGRSAPVAAQPTVSGPVAPGAATTTATASASAVDAAVAADAVGDVLDPTPRRDLRRNPFLIALLVFGTALVAGGLAWANQGRDIVTSHGGATTELDYWFIQATVFGSPIAVALGVALVAGVLFFFAHAWNRR